MQIQMPPQCQFILDQFEKHHLEAYLVGGCVRDRLLGKEPKDWDICTEALPEQTREIFKDQKVILTGLQHGTVTVLLQGLPIEITTYRIDGEYEDNRHPKEVFFTNSLQEDLSRRDFTINALAYHPNKGVVDFFDGMKDLKQGIVRCVGDAASRYQEDGLRILRAIRFACVLKFDLEIQTKAAIRQYSYLLRNIATERIQVEFNKILTSAQPAYGLELLATLHCFSYFIPEICHTWQFAQQGGRHQYDIFTHTVRAVEFVPPKLTLRLAMFFHDIGKPLVWQEQDGIDQFPQHGVVGAMWAKKILERLRYDKRTIQQVQTLIAHHEEFLQPEFTCLRKAVSGMGEELVRDLIEVKRADVRAHSDAMAEWDLEPFCKMEKILDQIRERQECCNLKQLKVTGKDVAALGYRGKNIGAVLDRLLQIVLEDPSKNDREELLMQIEKDCYHETY